MVWPVLDTRVQTPGCGFSLCVGMADESPEQLHGGGGQSHAHIAAGKGSGSLPKVRAVGRPVLGSRVNSQGPSQKPPAQTHTAAPHCGSLCHQLSSLHVCLTLHTGRGCGIGGESGCASQERQLLAVGAPQAGAGEAAALPSAVLLRSQGIALPPFYHYKGLPSRPFTITRDCPPALLPLQGISLPPFYYHKGLPSSPFNRSK